MTREDISNIISAICPNDEDFEKPIISPKYLKQELEQLALEQEQEPKTDVLDKIRAEIEAKCCITVGRENDAAITLHDVFEIIDKYRAESEG